MTVKTHCQSLHTLFQEDDDYEEEDVDEEEEEEEDHSWYLKCNVIW